MMQQRIILSGMGGQGVLSLGNLMGLSGMNEDKYVSIVPSYGAEMRGGISNCFVTISDNTIGAPVFTFADIGIFLYQPAMNQYAEKILESGLILYNENMIKDIPHRDKVKFIGVPANSQAEKIGSVRSANMIMAGLWCKMKNTVKQDTVIKCIQEMFKGKDKKIIDINIEAFKYGFNFT